MGVTTAAAVCTELKAVISALNHVPHLSATVQGGETVRTAVSQRDCGAIFLSKHKNWLIRYCAAKKLALNQLARPRRHIPSVSKHLSTRPLDHHYQCSRARYDRESQLPRAIFRAACVHANLPYSAGLGEANIRLVH